ncbi:hypothetical protein [Glycomyces albidus]|uniref:Uncharacterized protein n=1 Tax=Glycomyces albidus TaxID=2656774 RepID=A0A6L5G4H6_9ACTN|nr:hypothetical protein [Glycomyces albidus]MQM24530.1 hypothetical protein [Glycomyces albidus]
MQGERIGAMIGAVGGLVFILVNAGGLPGPLPVHARIAGAAAFALVLWLVLRRPPAAGEPPSRSALRTYWICVAAEVVAIPLGASVINNVLEQPDLTVCWVVLVVGAHFLPFARAFAAPVFTPLGWILVGLAVAGGALTLATSAVAAAATAVLAGAVLLGFSALGGRRSAAR